MAIITSYPVAQPEAPDYLLGVRTEDDGMPTKLFPIQDLITLVSEEIPEGPQGPPGEQGEQGEQGIQGIPGVSGTYGLFAQTANSIPVANTAVETTIVGSGVGTLTIPANSFSIGDSFTCALDGILSSGSSATLHIRIKTLTGVILADTGIINMSAATDKPWVMNLYFTVRELGGATVASISSGGLFSYIRNGGTQFEGYVLSTVNNTTFNTTINNTLVITAQWDPASTGNSIVSKNFTLTKVY